MSNLEKTALTLWIQEVLKPAVFENADKIFHEMEFKKRGTNIWESPKKLYGEKPKKENSKKSRIDNTPIPGAEEKSSRLHKIFEQGGTPIDYITYIRIREGLTKDIDATFYLAEALGLEVPSDKTYNTEEVRNRREKTKILNTLNDLFINELHGPSGSTVLEYLNKDRGLTIEAIKDAKLGIPIFRNAADKRLSDLGFNRDLINNVLNDVYNPINDFYKLSIPFIQGGNIQGFKFRIINEQKDKNGNKVDRYRNSKTETGQSFLERFYNISPNPERIVIVEGELDAITSEYVAGVKNTVAIASNSAHGNKLADAINKGCKKFIICFDVDPLKPNQTHSDYYSAIIKNAKNFILEFNKSNVSDVNFAELNESLEPSPVKIDANSFIKKNGIDAYKEVIDNSLIYYRYLFNLIYRKWILDPSLKVDDDFIISDEVKDNFVNELLEVSDLIKNDFHRDYFIELIKSDYIRDYLKIKEETFSNAVKKRSKAKLQEEQLKKVKDLTSKVSKLNKSDNLEEVITEIETGISDIKYTQDSNDFASFLEPITEDKIIEEEINTPAGLNVDLWINGEEYELPSSAISVFVGPTNHGKTVMLINSILNATKNDETESKKFVFFTYEERANVILSYILSAYIGQFSDCIISKQQILRYFKTNDLDVIKPEYRANFVDHKNNFFKEYIDSGRIIVKHVDLFAEDLCNAITYLNNSADIGGVFIDYFQLIGLKNKKGVNARHEELKTICQLLNRVANTTKLPIVLAAQFNQTVKGIDDVHITNIGEAGDISRIANLVVSILSIPKIIKESPIISTDDGSRNKVEVDLEKNYGSMTDHFGVKLFPYYKEGLYVKVLKSRISETGKYDFLQFKGYNGYVNFKTSNKND